MIPDDVYAPTTEGPIIRPAVTASIDLAPGEFRALAKLSALHPHVLGTVTKFRDEADVGWVGVMFVERTSSSRRPLLRHYYVASATGRAWRSNERNERIEPPIIEAYYE